MKTPSPPNLIGNNQNMLQLLYRRLATQGSKKKHVVIENLVLHETNYKRNNKLIPFKNSIKVTHPSFSLSSSTNNLCGVLRGSGRPQSRSPRGARSFGTAARVDGGVPAALLPLLLAVLETVLRRHLTPPFLLVAGNALRRRRVASLRHHGIGEIPANFFPSGLMFAGRNQTGTCGRQKKKVIT